MRKKFAERAPVDKIPGLIKPLFGAFNVQATAENIKFYVEAVADLQPWAIEQAISEFRRGRVPEHDGNFIPKPAQVAKRALAIVDEKATRLEREKSKAQAQEKVKLRRPDGQTRARQVRDLAFKTRSFPDQAFMKGLPVGAKIQSSPLQTHSLTVRLSRQRNGMRASLALSGREKGKEHERTNYRFPDRGR